MTARPEYATQFDKDLNCDVVLMRTSPTEEYQKYVFDTKLVNFVPAPQVVRVSDLYTCHEKLCDRHKAVAFSQTRWTRNLKHGRTFKYARDESTGKLRRVQCTCCRFEDYDPHSGIHYTMNILDECNPNDLVDMDTANFLWLRPFYSDICSETNEVVVFMLKYPETKKLAAYSFNTETQYFLESDCECKKCTEINHTYNMFSHGSQGIGYQRTHRDRNFLPLLPLAITKDYKYSREGVMEYFSDENGYIGKYKYDSDRDFYALVELLDVRVHSNMQDMEPRPELLLDDDLRLFYIEHCREMKRDFYFGFHRKDKKPQQYTFNEVTLQFDLFKCSDCHFDQKKAQLYLEDKPALATTCKLTGRDITVSYGTNGVPAKTIRGWDSGSVEIKMGKAPIRNLLHYEKDQLIAHFYSIRTYKNLLQFSEIDGTEQWNASGQEMDALIGMDGHVKLRKVVQPPEESQEEDGTDKLAEMLQSLISEQDLEESPLDRLFNTYKQHSNRVSRGLAEMKERPNEPEISIWKLYLQLGGFDESKQSGSGNGSDGIEEEAEVASDKDNDSDESSDESSEDDVDSDDVSDEASSDEHKANRERIFHSDIWEQYRKSRCYDERAGSKQSGSGNGSDGIEEEDEVASDEGNDSDESSDESSEDDVDSGEVSDEASTDEHKANRENRDGPDDSETSIWKLYLQGGFDEPKQSNDSDAIEEIWDLLRKNGYSDEPAGSKQSGLENCADCIEEEDEVASDKGDVADEISDENAEDGVDSGEVSDEASPDDDDDKESTNTEDSYSDMSDADPENDEIGGPPESVIGRILGFF
ncbi:hypothetical protein L5515_002160 [Caenorhabditis briggsae]|nr:hypothetical protein L5515_002160 [Caenorhabditis briggsae]